MTKVRLVFLVSSALGLGLPPAFAQDKPVDAFPGKSLVCDKGPSGCTFSRDGKRVAYIRNAGGTDRVVADGQEGKTYGIILANTLSFSPDGQHLVYAACEQKNCHETNKWLVVLDGAERASPELPNAISLNPDGSRLAVVVESRKTRTSYVVVDGEAQKPYDMVYRPIFSNDGKRYAYLAKREKKVFVVVDGKEEPGAFDSMSCRFSPDSQRMLYEGQVNGKTLVFLDGRELGQYDEVQDVSYSDDGQQLAYTAKRGDDWFVVVNGKESKPYKRVWKNTLRFSPDGKRFGFIASNKKEFKNWVPVVDGKEGAKFDWGTPLISPPGGAMGLNVPGTLVFSPDGKRVAYLAHWAKPFRSVEKSGKDVTIKEGSVTTWSLVVDGKAHKSYDDIRAGSVAFSPDGRRVSYVVKSKGKQFVVVDAKEGAPFDGILPSWGSATFDSNEVLRYLAHEGSNVYSVSQSLD